MIIGTIGKDGLGQDASMYPVPKKTDMFSNIKTSVNSLMFHTTTWNGGGL